MKRYVYNSKVFSKRDDITYYLLGAFMTDGNIIAESNLFSVTSKDKNWLSLIGKEICPGKPVRKMNNCFRIDFTNQKLCSWLQSHNVTPLKSLTVSIPKVPKKYWKDFMRGCIDGDGCITTSTYIKRKNNKIYTYTKTTCGIVSGSKHFMNQFAGMLDVLELNYSRDIIPARTTMVEGRKVSFRKTYRLRLSDRFAKRFIKIIYSNSRISLPRKQKLAEKLF